MDDSIEAIRRLTNEYALFFDTQQTDRWISLFAEDGVLDFTPAGGGKTVGHTDLLAFAQGSPSRNAAICHMVGNQIIDVDGEAATGTCYTVVRRRSHDGTESAAGGYYQDEYARTADGWIFRSRMFTPLV